MRIHVYFKEYVNITLHICIINNGSYNYLMDKIQWNISKYIKVLRLFAFAHVDSRICVSSLDNSMWLSLICVCPSLVNIIVKLKTLMHMSSSSFPCSYICQKWKKKKQLAYHILDTNTIKRRRFKLNRRGSKFD